MINDTIAMRAISIIAAETMSVNQQHSLVICVITWK